MKTITVVFLRGLNTYGDDLQHLGPWTFGPIAKPLARAFSNQGIELLTVEGLGGGDLYAQLPIAKNWLLQKKLQQPIHLLGHSQGGLLARALAQELKQIAITSVTTIGTPHFGTPIVQRLQQKNRLQTVLKHLNYDLNPKWNLFTCLTEDSLLAFNRQYKDKKEIHYGSVVCYLPLQMMSLPYQVMRLTQLSIEDDSDGLVPRSSQYWGASLGEFHLDHLMQMGFCFDARPSIRKNFQREFLRMTNTLRDFWRKC